MQDWLLRGLLPQVSRSFYLTLKILPESIRTQVGLAYLFCRAADTIADTDLLPPQKRLSALLSYREMFFPETPDRKAVRELCDGLVPSRGLPGEALLLEHLSDCFDLLESSASDDQRLIGNLVRTLTRGMEMDLVAFSQGKRGAPQALPALSDLDRYIYFVAGVVGDFWTRICCARLPALRKWDEEKMAAVGVRFGKGLQMTNVLKDLARDLARGRCYLPSDLLQKHRLDPESLLEPSMRGRALPILRELAFLAMEHLDCGRDYLLAIPRSEVRLRLACAWPLLFALSTLRKVLESSDLLDPKVTVKISRRCVYFTLFFSSFLVFSDAAMGFWYRILRGRLTQSLAKPI